MEDAHMFNQPINPKRNWRQEQETGICSKSVDRAITLTPTTCPYLILKLAAATGISEVMSLN